MNIQNITGSTCFSSIFFLSNWCNIHLRILSSLMFAACDCTQSIPFRFIHNASVLCKMRSTVRNRLPLSLYKIPHRLHSEDAPQGPGRHVTDFSIPHRVHGFFEREGTSLLGCVVLFWLKCTIAHCRKSSIVFDYNNIRTWIMSRIFSLTRTPIARLLRTPAWMWMTR